MSLTETVTYALCVAKKYLSFKTSVLLYEGDFVCILSIINHVL